MSPSRRAGRRRQFRSVCELPFAQSRRSVHESPDGLGKQPGFTWLSCTEPGIYSPAEPASEARQPCEAKPPGGVGVGGRPAIIANSAAAQAAAQYMKALTGWGRAARFHLASMD
ncbi:MAG: hypothetical protein EHM70_06550 [Chloroflexota bacterium]|nr:MAG: hypothetical protein EHM70_06550 [Chloroflexota bacterium]